MFPNDELLNEFKEEAKGHINTLEAGLIRMETGANDAETINEIFRAVHSVKGTAGFFELGRIVELAHVMESFFGALRDNLTSLDSDKTEILLEASDLLRQMVGAPDESDKQEVASHIERIKAFTASSAMQPAPKNDSQVSAWDLWDQLTVLDQKEQQKTSPAVPAEAAVLPEPEVKPETPPPQPEAKPHSGIMGDSVRVSVSLLNDLLNMVGQMVLRRNQLLRIAQNAGKDVPQLEVIARGIDSLTTNLQEKVMKTRMQPVSNVFNKLPRIVREISRKLHKEVELVMEGLEVELDRSIIEALVDPITHLVRNALDHGIELPEARIAKHKTPAGTLMIHAYHESGRVIVAIRDDGAGIDTEKVKAKALAKGLVTEAECLTMRENEILNMIMRPGFSTAEQITDISGRGVGMDVVRTNIEKLGGKIEIITEKGKSTTFLLNLPLTLAIISSFIVEAAGNAFAVPQANVKELVLIQPDSDQKDKKVEFIQNYPILHLRNQLLPLVRLADVLDLLPGSENKIGRDNFDCKTQTLRILIIKSGSLRYGLIVDSVYDTEEILVKPLPSGLSTYGCYSGVTVLGDGRVAMIIDPESLRIAASLCPPEELSTKAPQEEKTARIGEEQYILLFKCSGGEMLGIDMAMVSRVEEIETERIQRIGAKLYYPFRGETLRVIRPEYYLPIARKKNLPKKVYVVLPKLVKHPIGIIVETIHDAILTPVRLDENGVVGTGVVGSTLIGDTVVTLVDLYGLYEKAAPEFYGEKSEGRKHNASAPLNDSTKITVLLAEDTPFFARTTESYLKGAGYDVIVTVDGKQAFDTLLKRQVDLVISDIEMPQMNGIELVRAIRANSSLKHLPVIALTSLTGEANREKGLRAGFDHYEFKLDRTRLLESVSEILKRKAT